VHAPVGEVVAPGRGLRVEIEQVTEAAPGPEAAADEADGLNTVAVAECESTTVFMLSKMSTAVVPPKK
jgi:hypothetical protein